MVTADGFLPLPAHALRACRPARWCGSARGRRGLPARVEGGADRVSGARDRCGSTASRSRYGGLVAVARLDLTRAGRPDAGGHRAVRRRARRRCCGRWPGALRPTAGTVEVDGSPVARPDRGGRARASSLVPQGNGLRAVAHGRRRTSWCRCSPRACRPREAATRAARRARRWSGWRSPANHLVEELSGGQQQRVAVARALAAQARGAAGRRADQRPRRRQPGAGGRLRCGPRPTRGAVVVMATHDPRPRPGRRRAARSTTAG